MLPSRLTVLLALVPLVLGVLAAAEPSLVWPMLAADLALLVGLGLDAALARRRLVEVRRSVGTGVMSIGRPNPVRLWLRSRASHALTVEVNDDGFPDADADAEVVGLPARVELPANGRATLEYRVVPHRRGAHRLGDHWIRYRSPLRLWIRQLRIPADDAVRVYPDVQKVRVYDLLAQSDRELGMLRATRLRGGESEFECLREYTRDDEYRAIDWRATAHRRRLIARQYQLERDQSVVLALDCGRLMTALHGGLPAFDHALNAALMLCHVAIRRGDQAGLFAFSDRVHRFVTPGAGPSMVRRLLQATFDLHPALVESDYEGAFLRMSTQLRKRSLIVLVTTVIDDNGAAALLRTVRTLRPRHLPLCVMLRDPDLEAMARPRHDGVPELFEAAAAAELLDERARLLRMLRKAGALVLDVEPLALTPALVSRYLEIKARHLL